MAESELKTSILMLPWPAHFSSYFELAKKLSHKNFFIYFCSTSTNLKPVSDTHDRKMFSSVRLIDLHLPSSTPSDMAKADFSMILQTLKPKLLIYDSFLPWAQEAAWEQGIEAVLCLTLGAATSSSFVQYGMDPSSEEFPWQEFGFFEDEAGNGVKNKETFLESIRRSSNMVLINTSNEIEAKHIEHLTALVGKEVVPVGPLVQAPDQNKEDGNLGITGWLSEKPPSSVLYVSFGNNHISARQQIEELATGLELSGVSFIWVVRCQGGDAMMKIHEALPEGFLRRTGERGLVVEGLIPDGKVLSSSAIAGFVSVCDWSSAVEGLAFGVPVIAMAMGAEQQLNARLVAEIGAGMEVGREKGGIYKADEIARVSKVMLGEGGQNVRLKVKELSKNMREKGDCEMDLVVDKLLQLVK